MKSPTTGLKLNIYNSCAWQAVKVSAHLPLLWIHTFCWLAGLGCLESGFIDGATHILLDLWQQAGSRLRSWVSEGWNWTDRRWSMYSHQRAQGHLCAIPVVPNEDSVRRDESPCPSHLSLQAVNMLLSQSCAQARNRLCCGPLSILKAGSETQ